MIQPTNMQNPYPQTGGANAVAINIFNPQAYGSTPQPMAQQMPPYAYNSMYTMPNTSAYAYAQPVQMPLQQPMAYQQFIPMQVEQPQLIAPTPQTMPPSVIAAEAPIMQPAVQQTIVQQAPVQQEIPTQPQVAMDQTAPVEIVEPQQSVPVIDIDSLVANLKSADANVKAETIKQIATYAQESPEIALQVVSEPIMQSLVDVINEDTTKLEGPNAQQIAVAEKIAKGEQLTQEENAIAEQLSPRDMANKSRIFALYTLAMIQKLQRDELNQYIETQKANGQETIAPLNVQDLIGYNDVINIIQNDSRPEVQHAGIQALGHIIEPQDKAIVEPILTQAQNSTDEAIKTAATEALAKFQA